jgi:hypothetical protein
MKNKGMTKQHKKVLFKLIKDEDNYPPDDYESLWALPNSKDYLEIDNIPFFVQGISCGDVVDVSNVNGELLFRSVVKKSRNSTLRLICFDLSKVAEIRSALSGLGCSSELSHIQGLIAVDVPKQCDYSTIKTYLDQKEIEDVLEYEEAALRH